MIECDKVFFKEVLFMLDEQNIVIIIILDVSYICVKLNDKHKQVW